MSGDFVLTVALVRPGEELRPNGRAHWAVRARAVKRARALARVLTKRELARIRPSAELGEWLRGGVITRLRYDVTWFFWGGAGPDEDNVLASCKAYLDGCCDALRVNDRVLVCAGIHRVKDREQTGTVLIRFYV